MGLLSYNRLCELVEQGVIANVEHDQINATSIDITVGNAFMCEVKPDDSELYLSGSKIISYARREQPKMSMITVGSEGVVIPPMTFMLAQSQQVFNLPNTISCDYKLKSSMARIALEHLNAGWCDAGWNGSVLTLELFNMLKWHAIHVVPGDRIGQMIFFEHEEVPADRSYAARGRYNNDSTVSGMKP